MDAKWLSVFVLCLMLYNYKVSLYVDGTLVDSKTGTATATATFKNTGPTGALSSISVSVEPSLQYVPFNVGYF